MGQSPDQLRQEIDQKRQDAAQKIDQIEQTVTGQVQAARGTAEDTVQAAKDAVTDSTTAVKDAVQETVQMAKDNFDPKRLIEQNPLLAVGAGILGGFLLGGMSGGGGGQGQGQRSGSGSGTGFSAYDAQGGHSYQGSSPSGGQAQGLMAGGLAATVQRAAQSTGLEDTLTNATNALMQTVSDRLKATLDQSFPGFADKLMEMAGGNEGGGGGQGASGTGSSSQSATGRVEADPSFTRDASRLGSSATAGGPDRTASYIETDAGRTGAGTGASS